MKLRFNNFLTMMMLCSVSDVYVVGSDQTWNPTISKDYALAYFLDFGKDNQRRIPYASSFGTSTWIDSDVAKKDNIKRLLSRFSALLVREDKAVEICKKEFGLEAKQVVDPVLLFPSYPELTGKVTKTNDIVIYKILNNPEFYKSAVDLGRHLGCNVRSIGSMRHPEGVKTAYPERIEKWVSNIAGAKYVFTDSFHGTVLSLLYHRQFVVYVGDKEKMSRLKSILKLVGLGDRFFSSPKDILSMIDVIQKPIDYNKVDRILDEQRKQSIDLLREAMSSNKFV